MGLAFVRAIVRRHGGELEIESGSSGSTVTMRV
jgi:signal transduction histidine kinase